MSDSNQKLNPAPALSLQTIEEVHHYYQTIIAAMPNHVYWLNKDCTGVGCNNNILRRLGLKSPDEFRGISHEQMAELSGYTLEQAIEFKKKDSEVIATGIPRLNIEEAISVGEGKFIYYLTSRIPLFDEQGHVTRVLVVSTDVTTLKKAEKEFLVTKEKLETADRMAADYRRLIFFMPNNVYWWDKEGVALGCNYNTVKFLGLNSQEEFVGMTYEKASQLADWTGDQGGSFRKDDLEVITTGISKLNKEEPPITDISGKIIYQLTSRVPLYNKNNDIIGVVGISVDITDRKKIEQELYLAKEAAEAANRAKTEFLSNMQHDIRTPLTGIIGCAQLIQLTANNPEKVLEYAEDLIESSNALLEFLNRVLDAIKVASGELSLLRKRFNFHKQFQEVINLNKSLAAKKNLVLTLDYDEKIPTCLIGDPVRLQRIVLELLTNALTFTQQGTVSMAIKLKRQETHQVIIEIKVCDTGIGIALDKQEEIFIRFKRLTPSYRGIYKGLGLGLTFVKQFIDDLGGEIYVVSQLEKGSTFTCLIPFQEPLVADSIG